MVHDIINQEVRIAANIERVFDAIANPEKFGKWFSNGVEGDFAVGSQPIIDEGEYGKFRLAIIGNSPHNYFAWRWVSGMEFVPQGFIGDPLEHPNTLVEFFLESTEDGTIVKVVESGFASLPEHYAAKNYEDNTGGWEFQLNKVKGWIEANEDN